MKLCSRGDKGDVGRATRRCVESYIKVSCLLRFCARQVCNEEALALKACVGKSRAEADAQYENVQACVSKWAENPS